MCTIRPYKDKDRSAVEAVCAGEAGTFKEPFLDVFCRYYIEKEPQNCFIAANRKDEAIGYILCAENFETWENLFTEEYLKKTHNPITKGMGKGTIHGLRKYAKEYPAHLHIDITETYQRRGIGTKLMDALLEHLKEKRVSGVMFSVAPDNEKGVNFYKKYGFVELGRTEQEITMGMKLMKPFIIPQPESIQFLDGYFSKHNNHIQEIINDGIVQEGYILEILPDSIKIEACSPAGFFYGKKTLEQLQMQYNSGIPCMKITDAPRYPYRSFHLDCARHFISAEELKKNIQCAAAFKLNYFHWHFSDDQGYRMESEVLPLLTKISTKRKGDNFGGNRDNTVEQNFYTKDEVREIIAFARENFIEIVPEVDMPGHVTAILAAYPKLSCTEEKHEVATREGIYSDLLCAGKEETYEFLDKLLNELADLFPGKYFHIGGDETPKTKWKECACCKKKMEDENLSTLQQLQGYLQNRAARILKKKGKTVIAWNEAALGNNLDIDIIIQLWNDDPNDPAMKAFHMKDENGNFTSPNQGIGAKHIRRGGKVISSNMLYSYCDYPHAFVKAKAIYETDIMPQKCEDIAEAKANVLGGEAVCWTEHIRTNERLEYMIWPRFAVKADRLWSLSVNRDFNSFMKREKVLYNIFEKYGISPAPPNEFVPGPAASEKQMMEFMELLGGGNADEYRDANKEI